MATRPAQDPVLAQLVTALDQAYRRPSWHGTNLRGSLRGLTPKRASARPGPGRHNIWELVLHCAYWKYAVWRLLTGATRGSFPLAGSNFFKRPEKGRMTTAAWRADLELLDQMHTQLRAAVNALDRRALKQRGKGRYTKAGLVAGVTAHDLYHAGQIQLIKALRGQTHV